MKGNYRMTFFFFFPFLLFSSVFMKSAGAIYNSWQSHEPWNFTMLEILWLPEKHIKTMVPLVSVFGKVKSLGNTKLIRSLVDILWT